MIKGPPRRHSRGGGGKTLLFSQVCDRGPSTTAGRCLSHPALSRVYRTHCHHHHHHHQGWYPLRGTESLFSDLCAHVFIWKLLVSRDALVVNKVAIRPQSTCMIFPCDPATFFPFDNLSVTSAISCYYYQPPPTPPNPS